MFWLILLFCFTVLPALELTLLIMAGSQWGGLETLVIVLLTGVAGTSLARRQGIMAWHRVQEALIAGRLPTHETLDGILILAAGLLLISPGFITDSIGIFLLIPWGRSLVGRMLVRYFTKRTTIRFSATVGGQKFTREEGPRQDGVLDMDATELPDDKPGQSTARDLSE